MISVGQLNNVCSDISNEYGDNTSICLQIFNSLGEIIETQFLSDIKVSKNGTLYLIAKKNY